MNQLLSKDAAIEGQCRRSLAERLRIDSVSLADMDLAPIGERDRIKAGFGGGIVQDTLRILFAESLALPIGLLTASYLTRRLGPEGYGFFTLAFVPIAWVEGSINALLSRTSLQFLGTSEDWKAAGIATLKTHLLIGLIAGAGVWLLASPIGVGLGNSILPDCIRLFAVGIPLFALAQAYRQILIAFGHFKLRAWSTVVFWLGRFLLIVVFVELGLSIKGAILGVVGASALAFIFSHSFVRLVPWGAGALPIRRFFALGLPIFAYVMSIRLLERLDLVMLKALGGSISAVGIYGAAQNISILAAILAMSLSPLLISRLTSSLRIGDEMAARRISHQALRAVVATVPGAAIIAGAADEIAASVFGSSFATAGPLMAVLMFGSLGLLMISVATAILTAAGEAGGALYLCASLVPVAAAAHFIVIPRYGAPGAALATFSVFILGAAGSVLMVYRLWRILPPAGTCLRSLFLSLVAYVLTSAWPCTGPELGLKLCLAFVVVGVGFVLTGELKADELRGVQSLLPAGPARKI